MNEEWKMRPYFGVLPLVFRALRHIDASLVMSKKSCSTRLMLEQ